MKQAYSTWPDAKHAAIEASLPFGFSYIVGDKAPFSVVTCEQAEKAPSEFSAEFKDGVEQ
jgi:hypothetical protein